MALAGCSTTRLTEPGQTATEQLIISTAIDRAVAQFDPKIPIFERDKQIGIAKLALTGYGKDGALALSTGPRYGTSDDTQWTVLLFISWTHQDILPESAKK